MHEWRSNWISLGVIGALGLATAATAAPMVEFRADTSSAVESFQSPAIQVVLSEAPTGTVTVAFEASGGSAKGGGVDYTRTPGTLTFPAGLQTNAIPLSIVDDAIPEPAETVVLRLYDPAGASLGDRTHHTYTILDNDGYVSGPPPGASDILTVQFLGESSGGAERQTPARMQVVLSWPTSAVVKVDYQAFPGTAKPNDDFEVVSGTLEFPAGATSLNIEAGVVDDEIAESNETFRVVLSDADGAELGPVDTHTYTIKDDDTVLVGFVPVAAQGPEEDGTVDLAVEIQGLSEKELQVSYRVSGNATPGADFIRQPETLIFPPEVYTQTVQLVIMEDEITEADEDIVLTLEQPKEVIIGPFNPYTYIIQDDDEAKPDVTIRRPINPDLPPGGGGFNDDPTEWDADATLGGEGDDQIEIWVGISATASVPVKIEFTGGGSARWGEDYQWTGGGGGEFEWEPDTGTGTITIYPGFWWFPIIIFPIDDGIEEADETIIITVTNSVGARLGHESDYTVWLRDNDRPPEPLRFFKQMVAARDPGQVLTVLGPKTTTVLVRGLAVDGAGNYYISDQAPTRGIEEGGIWLWPDGEDHVTRIMKGLTRPGDIELSLDGRELVIAGPNGAITRRAFGVSVRVTNLDPLEPGVYVYAKTDLGTIQSRADSDGYFHIPEVLVPAQTSPTIDIIIEKSGETSPHFGIPLAQPGFSEPFGQRVIRLEF